PPTTRRCPRRRRRRPSPPDATDGPVRAPVEVRMQIAVYGGSFNPPHVGHAMVMSWLRWTGRAEAVWLLPTFHHAFGKDLAPWPLRVELCEQLAALAGGSVSVCTVEAELPAPSYTIDTLRELARRHPEHRFRMVIGSDNLAVLDKWKDW